MTIHFIRHWNFTMFKYNLHYMAIWMTKLIVPPMYIRLALLTLLETLFTKKRRLRRMASGLIRELWLRRLTVKLNIVK